MRKKKYKTLKYKIPFKLIKLGAVKLSEIIYKKITLIYFLMAIVITLYFIIFKPFSIINFIALILFVFIFYIEILFGGIEND